MQANTTTDKASRRATAERDPGPAAGAPAAAAPAQVPAMDMAPLRAAPQGRSLEVKHGKQLLPCSAIEDGKEKCTHTLS